MSSYRSIARSLAMAFLSGSLNQDELLKRGARLLGKRWRFLHPLTQRIAIHFIGKMRPRLAVLTSFIMEDRSFSRAFEAHDLQLVHRQIDPPEMAPIQPALHWHVPPLRTVAELAEWLAITPRELEWFSDLRFLGQKQPNQSLRHYRYRPLAKRFGQIRLIEAPKDRLKSIQWQIQTRLLDRIPPHDAAHGFRRGRSIKTFSRPHLAKSLVIKIDLQDFFPTIRQARVQALFRSLGYPECVADRLAGLCIHSTPPDIWNDVDLHHVDLHRRNQAKWLYAQPHLPQGAPTSPSIANLCAFRLDVRLDTFAAASGASYTRYADDLAFSGDADFARSADRFRSHVEAIILEEGFRVHFRKTRLMRPGVCQRLAGLVVNRVLNVPRADRDQLKAILTNCIRFGPASQNRTQCDNFRSHLHGRISFIESIHLEQGRKLRDLFERIQW